MDRTFTRQELYDLVWSQPIRALAHQIGISDVALAKHCKKANVPVPPRGYWARKQSGKPVVTIALPPRFPGARDQIGGDQDHRFYNNDWAERFSVLDIPSEPVFAEEMTAVEARAVTLVGKVRPMRAFEPAHPLVAKLLTHDEERRREFLRYQSSWNTPLYDAGIERRRLLIINTLFLAAARLGCRPDMRTSKYLSADGDRDLYIRIGEMHVSFTIEPIKSKSDVKKQRLRLALGTARDRASATTFWEDDDDSTLEQQLNTILVAFLTHAEDSYRKHLAHHREWLIERKAAAKAELQRRHEEAERAARALEEKNARERIAQLLAQARALDRANQIRTYVAIVLAQAGSLPVAKHYVETWGNWAQREADRIDPLKNGTVLRAVSEGPNWKADPIATSSTQHNVSRS